MAIIFNEPDRDRFLQAILGARRACMSAATVVEVAAVYASAFQDGDPSRVAGDLARLRIEVEPMTADQAWIAAKARFTYGRGRNGLNIGDCFAYALATSLRAPLLFKGNDFVLTDVSRAL